MDLRQLRCFIAVAEEGNVGRAAGRLHLSQPPLTRQIHRLEEELGTQLFVRTPKGVALTEAGKVLLDDAHNIRGLVEEAEKRVRRTGRGERGRLDVGICGPSMLKLIPAILAAFRRAHPDVDVALSAAHHDALLDALRQQRIAVLFDRVAPAGAEFRVDRIAEEKVVVALNRSSALARKRMLEVEDLRDEALILPEGPNEGGRSVTLDLCRAHGFEPCVSQQSAELIGAIAMVSAGFGSCLVPESAAALRLPAVVYRPLKEGAEQPYALQAICLPREPSPPLRGLLEVARQLGVG